MRNDSETSINEDKTSSTEKWNLPCPIYFPYDPLFMSGNLDSSYSCLHKYNIPLMRFIWRRPRDNHRIGARTYLIIKSLMINIDVSSHKRRLDHRFVHRGKIAYLYKKSQTLKVQFQKPKLKQSDVKTCFKFRISISLRQMTHIVMTFGHGEIQRKFLTGWAILASYLMKNILNGLKTEPLTDFLFTSYPGDTNI